jgi:hypothetical protein
MDSGNTIIEQFDQVQIRSLLSLQMVMKSSLEMAPAVV